MKWYEVLAVIIGYEIGKWAAYEFGKRCGAAWKRRRGAA